MLFGLVRNFLFNVGNLLLLFLWIIWSFSICPCRPFNASSKLFRHCWEVHLTGQPKQITQQQRSKWVFAPSSECFSDSAFTYNCDFPSYLLTWGKKIELSYTRLCSSLRSPGLGWTSLPEQTGCFISLTVVVGSRVQSKEGWVWKKVFFFSRKFFKLGEPCDEHVDGNHSFSIGTIFQNTGQRWLLLLQSLQLLSARLPPLLLRPQQALMECQLT